MPWLGQSDRAAIALAIAALCAFGSSAEGSYQEALAALSRGDLDKATRLVREAVALKPEFPEAYNTLGLLLGRRGEDPVSVIQAFQTAIRQRESFAEPHYHLGVMLAQLGRLDDCISELRKAVSYEPDNADMHNALGLALMDRNMSEAIAEIQRAIELRPRFIEAEFNLALAYRRKFGMAREIPQLRRVLEMEPAHMLARNTLTRRLEEMGQFNEALANALLTVEQHPDSPEAHLFAGKGLLKKGDTAAAVEQLRLAIAGDTSLTEAHHHLGMALRALGRNEEAVRELKQAAALREREHIDIAAGLRMSEADLKMQSGDLAGAAVILRSVIQDKPEWPDAHVKLGQILMRENNFGGARREFQAAVDRAPENFEAVYSLAFSTAAAGEYDLAEPLFRRAVALRPSSAEAHYNIAIALAKNGRSAEAIREFKETTSLAPTFSAAYVALGRIYLEKGSPTNAIGVLQRASELDPNSLDCLALLETALRKTGRTREAAGVAAQIVSLRHEQDLERQASSKIAAGLEQIRSGKPQVGTDLFREAVRIAPQLPQAHQLLGTALLDLNPVEAEQEFEKALSLRPTYFEALYNLGLVKARTGRMQAAIADFRRAIEVYPDSADCHDSLGVALAMEKNYSDAIVEFRAALAARPDWALAHYHLGSALKFLGEIEAARAAFVRAEDLDPHLKNPIER